MNKVYIVSSGQFSDYRIHAIFSTEENAKEFIEYNNKILKNKDFFEIEEWDVDVKIEEIKSKLPMFKIRIAKDGTILSINKLVSWEIDFQKSIPDNIIFNDCPWMGKDIDKYYKEGVLLVNTFARDEEHAKKIAIEKRQQILREGKWK